MLVDTQPYRVRFSREYAVLILRYLPRYFTSASTPEMKHDANLNTLNSLAHALLRNMPEHSYGLSVGRRLHVCDYGAIGYAAMNCANLLDALNTINRFRSLICSGIAVCLKHQSNGHVYTVSLNDDTPELFPLIELELASTIRFLQLTTRSSERFPVKVKEVSLRHSPLAPISSYEQVFGCTPSFNATSNALRLDSDNLQQPTYYPNPAVFRVLNEKLKGVLEEEGAQMPFLDRVRAYIASTPKRFPSQHEVASHFCLSVSCLKTKLRKEGCSFREIVDEERFKLAERHLRKGHQSIKQISFSLGFADQSSFNRAFKRWSGSSPKAYRLEESE